MSTAKTSAKKPVDTVAAFENKLMKWFVLHVYAGLKDIETERGVYGVTLINSLHQNFDNLMEKKGEQTTGLSGRFTMQATTKQMLRIIFRRVIEDIVSAEGSTDAEEIRNCLSDPVAPVLMDIYSRAAIGETLSSCPDVDGWLKSQIEGAACKTIKDIVALANIAKTVINCFRGLAWMVAVAVYYNSDTCTLKLVSTILITHGLNADLLDSITDEIVIKPPAPRKTKAKEGEKPPEEAAEPPAEEKDPLEDQITLL